VLFVLGAMGGGDVKLMAGLGTWMGPVPALLVLDCREGPRLDYRAYAGGHGGRLRALFVTVWS